MTGSTPKMESSVVEDRASQEIDAQAQEFVRGCFLDDRVAIETQVHRHKLHGQSILKAGEEGFHRGLGRGESD